MKRERCSTCNRVIYDTDWSRGLVRDRQEWVGPSSPDGLAEYVEHTYDCENVKRRLTAQPESVK